MPITRDFESENDSESKIRKPIETLMRQVYGLREFKLERTHPVKSSSSIQL
jgi:hypothetical protein